jgi:hypothetical protein
MTKLIFEFGAVKVEPFEAEPVVVKAEPFEAEPVAVEALRRERANVVAEFKAMTFALMKMTGWRESVAMLVMERLIKAYEIGAELHESRTNKELKGKKLGKPPAEIGRLGCEVFRLTRSTNAALLVAKAFLIGWDRDRKRNRARPGQPKGGAPKKSAGATVVDLLKLERRVKKDGKLSVENKTKRYKLRKRLSEIAKG